MIIKLLTSAVSLALATYFIPGVSITGGFTSAGLINLLVVVFVLTLINIFIKPIITILSFPITLLTLGLFTFVVNALMIMLTDFFVDGFMVSSFFSAVLFSLILSLINIVFSRFTK